MNVTKIICLLLCLVSAAGAQQQKIYALKAARLFDSTAGVMIQPGLVIVVNGKVQSVGGSNVPSGAAVIDLNATFADQHRSGILNEQLTVNSLVETLAANVPGINRVRILVDGNTRETLAGHADLSEFFDVNAVGQTVTQGGQ